MTRYAESEIQNNSSNIGMINTNAVAEDNEEAKRPGRMARE